MSVDRFKEGDARQMPVSSTLHTLQNPHPFVSLLPTEILQDIFIQCAIDYHREYDGRPTRVVPSWINVSYVCQHWRGVALNCPTLWTHFFLMSRKWREVLFTRSEQAPLKIRASLLSLPDESRWLKMVEKILDHVGRIQELHLVLPTSYTSQQVLSRLSSRAPRLQHLNISVEDPSLEWPSALFEGDPPALRTLELSNCSAPLSSFNLNALTTLNLEGVPVRCQQSIEDFLAVLSCMRGLEHLNLSDSLPSATEFLSSPSFKSKTSNRIELPLISRFLTSAPLSTTVALFSCVNIPSNAETRLRCTLQANLLDNYAMVSSILAQRDRMVEDRALSSPTFFSLIMDMKDGFHDGVLSFNDSELNLEVWGYKLCDTNSLLRLLMDLEPDDEDQIITDLYCSIPLSRVRNLIVVYPTFSPDFWRRILEHLHNVQFIKLIGGNMPDFSVLSSADLTTRGNEQNDTTNLTRGHGQKCVLAPLLEELVLEDITFSLEGDFDPDDPAITRSCLFEALSTRPGSQGRLTLNECQTDPSGEVRLSVVMVWGDGNIHVVDDRCHV